MLAQTLKVNNDRNRIDGVEGEAETGNRSSGTADNVSSESSAAVTNNNDASPRHSSAKSSSSSMVLEFDGEFESGKVKFLKLESSW
jgi:hypothetical protein